MRVEGGFVVAIEAAAVADPAVGAFDHPAAWLDDEAAAGFRAGHDVDGDTSLDCGLGDSRAGVALIGPNVADVGAIRLA